MSTAPAEFTPDTPLHMTPLPNYRILTIRGADAQTFLQGQFTQDVTAVTTESAKLSAYCTAKGRMLASFILWQQSESAQEHVYQLMVRSDIADSFTRRLRMYVLRAKVTVEETDITPYGYWVGNNTNVNSTQPGPEPWQVITTESGRQVGLPGITGIRRGILIPGTGIDTSHTGQAQAGTPAHWAVLDILAGLPWVEKANQELFIPQDLNLDAIGAVSFTKGCYPGQEIVARSHYRGKLKRRMLNGVCENQAAAVAPGTDITDSTNTREPSGQVINAAALADTLYLLFEVRLEAAEHNRLLLGDENGPPITLLTMPYSLDKPALG